MKTLWSLETTMETGKINPKTEYYKLKILEVFQNKKDALVVAKKMKARHPKARFFLCKNIDPVIMQEIK